MILHLITADRVRPRCSQLRLEALEASSDVTLHLRQDRHSRQRLRRNVSQPSRQVFRLTAVPQVARSQRCGFLQELQHFSPDCSSAGHKRVMLPAPAKWYDRRDCVFVEFLVADSKDVQITFDKTKCVFSCLGGAECNKYKNELELFEDIDENQSTNKRTDRSVLCYLRKAQQGKAWPRLTKEKAKPNWLGVDFINWKNWEDDSDEDTGNYEQFSDMMHDIGGEDEVPDLAGADDDDSADSDDEKLEDVE